jgi:hypothetical protein
VDVGDYYQKEGIFGNQSVNLKVSEWDLFFGLGLGCGVGLVNFWIS